MMDVQKVNNLHNAAMEETDSAFFARRDGDEAKAQQHFRRAFELEAQAANLMAHTTIEPTRSVLHRSAATLALDCGRYDDAIRLIKTAMAGNPPAEIMAELHEVWDNVFHAMREKTAGD